MSRCNTLLCIFQKLKSSKISKECLEYISTYIEMDNLNKSSMICFKHVCSLSCINNKCTFLKFSIDMAFLCFTSHIFIHRYCLLKVEQHHEIIFLEITKSTVNIDQISHFMHPNHSFLPPNAYPTHT